RMVMDIIRPDSGEIRVLGSPPGVHARVGYLPEERGLYQRQRVGDVLQFLGELRGLERHVAQRRVEQYLDRVGLLETKKKRMGEVREIKQRFADNSVLIEADRDVAVHPAVARTEAKGHAVRVWLKDGEPPEKFLAGLLADGAKISRYERALPSMDDVFVKVVTS